MSSVKIRRSKKRPRSKKQRPFRDKFGRFAVKKKKRRVVRKKPRAFRDKFGRFTVKKRKRRAVKSRHVVKQKPRRPVPKKPKQTLLLPPPEITQKGDSFFVHVDGYPLDFIVRYVMALANDYIIRFIFFGRRPGTDGHGNVLGDGGAESGNFTSEWWNFKDDKFNTILDYINSKGRVLYIVYAPMK